MFKFITRFFGKTSQDESRPSVNSVQEALENFKSDIIKLGEYQTAIHINELIKILNKLKIYGENPAEWLEANLDVGLELLQMDIRDIAPSKEILDEWINT